MISLTAKVRADWYPEDVLRAKVAKFFADLDREPPYFGRCDDTGTRTIRVTVGHDVEEVKQ